MRGGCIVYMLRNSVTGAYNKPAITAFLRIPTHVSLCNEGREEQSHYHPRVTPVISAVAHIRSYFAAHLTKGAFSCINV